MKSCETCISPYLAEVDGMIEAGWKVKEVFRFLKGRYPDEVVPSYDSLLNHRRNHVEGVINRAVASSRRRQKTIRKEIKSSISSAEQLAQNLHMLSSSLDHLWSNWDTDNPQIRVLTGLITSVNKTIELLLKFNKEITEADESAEDVFDKLMFCIRDFPSELVNTVVERWQNYVQE